LRIEIGSWAQFCRVNEKSRIEDTPVGTEINKHQKQNTADGRQQGRLWYYKARGGEGEILVEGAEGAGSWLRVIGEQIPRMLM
jgi:hypothetical protein